MVNMLPRNAQWASFALGRMQMPWVAQSILLGGHVRVGLRTTLYLGKGVKATNGQLVERAVRITESLGSRVATPDESARSSACARAPDSRVRFPSRTPGPPHPSSLTVFPECRP